MSRILFIGGCADGRLDRDYGDAYTIRQAYSPKPVPKATDDTPAELELIRSAYRRESIVTGQQRLDFFVDSSLSVSGAILRLLDHYRPPQP